jgi:ubiquinone/menaquinone biosynthesis C-methylase UbiE
MGERLLWIGARELPMFAAIAGRIGPIGLGEVAAVAQTEENAAAVRRAAERAGVLANVKTGAPGSMPFDASSFDVAIIAGPVGVIETLPPDTRAQWLTEVHRVLRAGGRLIVIERYGHRRLLGLLPPGDDTSATGHATEGALQAAGFRPVRTLGRRQGLMFVEGLKRGQ